MSASPPESGDVPQKPNQEQISFRFCADCANMLYPKENKETSELMFACRTCQYSEKAASSCVYRNNLDTSIGETAGVTQDVGSDPTVGLPGFCTLCALPIRCSFCEDMTSKGCMWEIECDEEEAEEAEEEAEEEGKGFEDLKKRVEDFEIADHGLAGLKVDHRMAAGLPRSNKQCPHCKETEAVFFQSQQRSAETGMRLFYVCCSCGHIFQ